MLSWFWPPKEDTVHYRRFHDNVITITRTAGSILRPEYIGRVSLQSIAPPRSVGVLKEVIAQLESIDVQCISMVFPYTGKTDAVQPLQDSLILTSDGPGMSPSNPIDFIITGPSRVMPRFDRLMGNFSGPHVHYKIFVNGLTRSARMWFDLSENTIGRIPLSAFGPPRTVGAVLEPIMKLEEFSPSGYIFVPYEISARSFGTADKPLNIVVLLGYYDIEIRKMAGHLRVVSSGKPYGWLAATICGSELAVTPVFTQAVKKNPEIVYSSQISESSIAQFMWHNGCDIYVQPTPCYHGAWGGGGAASVSRERDYYLVINPSTREIGHLHKSRISFQMNEEIPTSSDSSKPASSSQE